MWAGVPQGARVSAHIHMALYRPVPTQLSEGTSANKDWPLRLDRVTDHATLCTQRPESIHVGRVGGGDAELSLFTPERGCSMVGPVLEGELDSPISHSRPEIAKLARSSLLFSSLPEEHSMRRELFFRHLIFWQSQVSQNLFLKSIAKVQTALL